MIPSMPLEDGELVFNFILISILQKKLNKELESEHDNSKERILKRINIDVKQMKSLMQQKQITVITTPVWYAENFLYYTFTWKGIEDKQEFWKYGLKHHLRNKYKEYL